MAPQSGLAIITGASTGIGFELTRLALAQGYDVVAAANEPIILDSSPRGLAPSVQTVEVDLSTTAGTGVLLDTIAGRPVDILCANAGTALGHSFLEQPVADWRHVVETNITGTLMLLHGIMPSMISRNSGRVLVSGSINGSIPGPYLAVYNATKAFLNNFTDALRDEIKGKSVTVTTLMPGPVETPVYARAGMLDTVVGSMHKPGPAGVARAGWGAMIAGEPVIVPGLLNKLVEAAAHIVPANITAAIHRTIAEPRSD